MFTQRHRDQKLGQFFLKVTLLFCVMTSLQLDVGLPKTLNVKILVEFIRAYSAIFLQFL